MLVYTREQCVAKVYDGTCPLWALPPRSKVRDYDEGRGGEKWAGPSSWRTLLLLPAIEPSEQASHPPANPSRLEDLVKGKRAASAAAALVYSIHSPPPLPRLL